MKLGFLTAPFPETPLMEVADWAAAADFEVLEIACWPMSGGVKRKYAGTAHIDVANLSESQGSEIKDQLAREGPRHLRPRASIRTHSIPTPRCAARPSTT